MARRRPLIFRRRLLRAGGGLGPVASRRLGPGAGPVAIVDLIVAGAAVAIRCGVAIRRCPAAALGLFVRLIRAVAVPIRGAVGAAQRLEHVRVRGSRRLGLTAAGPGVPAWRWQRKKPPTAGDIGGAMHEAMRNSKKARLIRSIDLYRIIKARGDLIS